MRIVALKYASIPFYLRKNKRKFKMYFIELIES